MCDVFSPCDVHDATLLLRDSDSTQIPAAGKKKAESEMSAARRDLCESLSGRVFSDPLCLSSSHSVFHVALSLFVSQSVVLRVGDIVVVRH